MIITCTNGNAFVDMGGVDTWRALTSTICGNFSNANEFIPLVLSFVETGKCDCSDCLMTARQFNMAHDELAKLPPERMIYDIAHPERTAPWGTNISPVITSCANYFTSGDGQDLFSEIVRVFCIAAYTKSDVEIM